MTNPVVVITGASSGIGKAAALKFADKGARLVLGARRKKLLDELVEQIESKGAEAVAEQVDVTDRDDIEQLAKRALKDYGRIDVWVNDAGVSTIGRFEEVPMDENERVIQTNLLGVMYGSATAVKQFRQQGKGVLINISSYLGKGSAPYQAAYTASKHAIVGLDDALRQELWANNEKEIKVCTVMPVSINTPFFRHAANHTGREVEAIPPIYPPDDVAKTIVDLAFRPKDEAFVGGVGKVLGVQRKFARKLTDKQMAWTTHRQQFEKAAPESDRKGSLYKPMKEGTETTDEWPETGKYVDAAGAALAALVPIALGVWLWKSRSNNGVQQEETQLAS